MLWHDGKIRNSSEAMLTANDRGLSLGDGLFETLPAFNGIAFLKHEHIARMKASADYLSIPFDQKKVERAIDDLERQPWGQDLGQQGAPHRGLVACDLVQLLSAGAVIELADAHGDRRVQVAC